VDIIRAAQHQAKDTRQCHHVDGDTKVKCEIDESSGLGLDVSAILHVNGVVRENTAIVCGQENSEDDLREHASGHLAFLHDEPYNHSAADDKNVKCLLYDVLCSALLAFSIAMCKRMCTSVFVPMWVALLEHLHVDERSLQHNYVYSIK
jgi:hypothetical protein